VDYSEEHSRRSSRTASSSADPGVVPAKHERRRPVHRHVEPVPPAHHPRQVRRPPHQPADEARHRHPLGVLVLPEVDQRLVPPDRRHAADVLVHEGLPELGLADAVRLAAALRRDRRGPTAFLRPVWFAF